MKNIHLIPTDKPSKLYLNGFQRLVLDDKIEIVYDDYSKNQNIYITSDEEIKEGVNQWYLDKFLNKPRNSSGSQYGEKQNVIILTTDQSLDGVQAIDDEFLEWFVQNPSCEEVEVVGDDCYYEIIIPKEEILCKYCLSTTTCCDDVEAETCENYPKEEPKQIKCYCGHTTYCDCSPLEEPKDVVLGSKTSLDAQMLDRFEPKQETLEEDLLDTAIQVVGSNNVTTIREFLVKHKWQQERSYSEEEVKHIVSEALESALVTVDLEQWFTQFRKK